DILILFLPTTRESSKIFALSLHDALPIYTPGVSQQDVEVVRNLFAGAATADKRALLEMLPQLIEQACDPEIEWVEDPQRADSRTDRKSTRLNSSHDQISYAVICLKKKVMY